MLRGSIAYLGNALEEIPRRAHLLLVILAFASGGLSIVFSAYLTSAIGKAVTIGLGLFSLMIGTVQAVHNPRKSSSTPSQNTHRWRKRQRECSLLHLKWDDEDDAGPGSEPMLPNPPASDGWTVDIERAAHESPSNPESNDESSPETSTDSYEACYYSDGDEEMVEVTSERLPLLSLASTSNAETRQHPLMLDFPAEGLQEPINPISALKRTDDPSKGDIQIASDAIPSNL